MRLSCWLTFKKMTTTLMTRYRSGEKAAYEGLILNRLQKAGWPRLKTERATPPLPLSSLQVWPRAKRVHSCLVSPHFYFLILVNLRSSLLLARTLKFFGSTLLFGPRATSDTWRCQTMESGLSFGPTGIVNRSASLRPRVTGQMSVIT